MEIVELHRLLHGINLKEPAERALRRILLAAHQPFGLQKAEKHRLNNALSLAFAVHQGVIRNEDVAYVIHCVRMAFRALEMKKRHKIFSLDLILIALTHDTIEDSAKSPVSYIELFRRLRALQGDVLEGVGVISRMDIETVDMYFERMFQSTIVMALIAKILDRIDNLQTLFGIKGDLERQKRKVLETEKWFTALLSRIELLVWGMIQVGTLERGWYDLVAELRTELQSVIATEKIRLGMT